ncbi:cytochrome P450 [Solimonas terrae]|uniref:Cytochrome P450 n=1 Tax=Solimonas terrae TaxID=1396819 RepID=A0A6M2BRH5_9GAMM|nr:cytochrome P450 [Solimonas terrae]NGY04811.1 cytochrome P450 [Solimonas terrae]
MTHPIPGTALLDPAVLDDPYPFYRRLQSEAPVWQVPGSRIFIITRHALLDEASRRVEDFSSNLRGVLYRGRGGVPARLTRQKGIPQILATADPPLHGVHRKAVFPELVAKRMATMAPDVEQVADVCITQLLQAPSADFMAVLGNPLPMTVVSKLVGFRGSNIDTLLQAAFDSTAVVSGSLSLFQLLKTIWRSATIQRWLDGQLREGSDAGDNILAAIKRNIESGTLRQMEGRAILHILLAAGGESTSSLLGNAVRMLAEDQALQQTLREQPDLIPAFLEEVLRLESPFRFHLRSTPKDTELGGVGIPEGATVLMFWSAGNRDPDVFARPDELDLSRPRMHMTFGRGIHTCVGAPLARLEGAIILRMLLARTKRITLTPGRTPKWVTSLQVRRHEQLHISIDS